MQTYHLMNNSGSISLLHFEYNIKINIYNKSNRNKLIKSITFSKELFNDIKKTFNTSRLYAQLSFYKDIPLLSFKTEEHSHHFMTIINLHHLKTTESYKNSKIDEAINKNILEISLGNNNLVEINKNESIICSK